MDLAKEKAKSVKKANQENTKNERTSESNVPEEKEFSWQLTFILIAFGIGTVLLILKIIGLI